MEFIKLEVVKLVTEFSKACNRSEGLKQARETPQVYVPKDSNQTSSELRNPDISSKEIDAMAEKDDRSALDVVMYSKELFAAFAGLDSDIFVCKIEQDENDFARE